MAHIGQKLTLCLIGMDSLFSCHFQFLHLLSGHPIVQDKDHHDPHDHGTTGKQHHILAPPTQPCDRIVQDTIGHNGNQKPVSLRKAGTIYVAVHSIDQDHGRIIGIVFHSRLNLIHIIF